MPLRPRTSQRAKAVEESASEPISILGVPRPADAKPPPGQGAKMMPLPLAPKLRNRLYMQIVFLFCLSHIPLDNKSSQTDSDVQAVDTSSASEGKVFQRFVNSLATVCDTHHGGKTVTAVTILDNPLTYVIASNDRKDEEMESLCSFVSCVLKSVPHKSIGMDKTVSSILDRVARMCKPRLRFYLRRLLENAMQAIESLGETKNNGKGGFP